MSSKKTSEPLHLERDLPTSRQDVVFLRRARERASLDLARFFQVLEEASALLDHHPPDRKTSKGWEPFTLCLLLILVLAAAPAAAGIHYLFHDGFEGGDTAAWDEPIRYVVFEGFYNPG
jgi:hypothetical protein